MTLPLSVLHVEDDAAFAELTASALEHEAEGIDVVSETDVERALSRIEAESFDCVVSDYDMPGMDGLSLLAAVRERDPDLPFILFTGKGSEEIASEAISAGVTDYVQKGGGLEQYAMLRKRIENAVSGRRALAELEREREFVDAALAGLTDVFYVFDETGRFLRWNDRLSEVTGYTDDEIREMHPIEFFPPEERAAITSAIGSVVEVGETVVVESVIETADGERIPYEFTGSPIDTDLGEGRSVCGVGRDITARKRTERELREQTAFVEGGLEGVIDFYYILDPNGFIRDWSEGTPEVVGYEPEELRGAHASAFVPEGSENEVAETLFRAVEEGRARVEVPFVGPDGTETPYEFTVVVVRDGEEVTGICGLARDVSERYERERALRRERDRLAAFASAVSHDLRNPLTVAQGHLELAREAGGDGTEEHFEEIDRALSRMETLVDHVLALAKEGRTVGETEPVALGSVVDDAWRALGDRGEATLERDELPTIVADESRLRQLVENLLRNAVDHGGERVEVSRLDDGFSIADDGPGVPPSERERIFDPGVSDGQGGIGLGLAIVEEVAEAHGWSVAVADSPDGGACFSVTGVERSRSLVDRNRVQ
ncbi:hybrid sensor histidine kinase/response regulator [Natronorarus salvus]|uniref:hybrid sensor histidine kinase/response regulator n=1 Tax=Natronorarus salvus TaxID=3117733 RepID=UPI002F26B2E3